MFSNLRKKYYEWQDKREYKKHIPKEERAAKSGKKGDASVKKALIFFFAILVTLITFVVVLFLIKSKSDKVDKAEIDTTKIEINTLEETTVEQTTFYFPETTTEEVSTPEPETTGQETSVKETVKSKKKKRKEADNEQTHHIVSKQVETYFKPKERITEKVTVNQTESKNTRKKRPKEKIESIGSSKEKIEEYGGNPNKEKIE